MSVCPSVCLSVRQSPKPLSLSELLLSTIDHQAYQPSSQLTIKPINLWSSFATFKPFSLFLCHRSTLLNYPKQRMYFPFWIKITAMKIFLHADTTTQVGLAHVRPVWHSSTTAWTHTHMGMRMTHLLKMSSVLARATAATGRGCVTTRLQMYFNE